MHRLASSIAKRILVCSNPPPSLGAPSVSPRSARPGSGADGAGMAIIMARIGTLFTQRGWVEASAQMDVRNGAATLLAGHAQRLGF